VMNMANPYLKINNSFFGALEATDISEKKLTICENCQEYVKLTKHCKKCMCIMPLKVKFKGSNCPLGKHNAFNEATI
jgi:hypothetical protein